MNQVDHIGSGSEDDSSYMDIYEGEQLGGRVVYDMSSDMYRVTIAGKLKAYKPRGAIGVEM
jgi:hypothetical protein